MPPTKTRFGISMPNFGAGDSSAEFTASRLGHGDGLPDTAELAYQHTYKDTHTHTHTHTRLTALCPGLPGWAGNRKVKSIWILLKQETVSGSGISWPYSSLLQTDNHASTPPLLFTGRMPFLPPNQQRQSTEEQGQVQGYNQTKTIMW